ncbi:MAG: hypothetical protein J6A15_09275 [Clostridia bacterium]|nr:hypothetical protein [Clostridia bacterium]
MQDLYIYVDKNKLDDCLKYGIKLSEFENRVLKLSNVSKRGIQAFLSPKDSELYLDESYGCIRVISKNLIAIVFNKICENTSLIDDFMCNIEDYRIGNYELPEAIICSSILPENLQLYNKILDKPLLVQNSREFYYEKCINEIMETDMFSKYELYQTLLILGDQKKLFNVSKENNVKMYTDSISGKKYTKRSN